MQVSLRLPESDYTRVLQAVEALNASHEASGDPSMVNVALLLRLWIRERVTTLPALESDGASEPSPPLAAPVSGRVGV